MQFIAIPDPRKGVTKEQLAALRSMAVLPGSLGAFASTAHFAEQGGVGMPSEGIGPKYWRDNSTIWNASRQSYEYTMLERDGSGNFVQAQIDWSAEYWSIMSYSACNFYRTYAGHFPIIPKLVKVPMDRFTAGRLNFAAKGIPADYPLGVDGGFPANCAVRFNPETGAPEVFNFEEYGREFPIDWTPKLPAVPGTGGKLSDEELVGAASGALASSMSVKDKAMAIRALANR
jgi:hypothetical protein